MSPAKSVPLMVKQEPSIWPGKLGTDVIVRLVNEAFVNLTYEKRLSIKLMVVRIENTIFLFNLQRLRYSLWLCSLLNLKDSV